MMVTTAALIQGRVSLHHWCLTPPAPPFCHAPHPVHSRCGTWEQMPQPGYSLSTEGSSVTPGTPSWVTQVSH